MNLLMPYDAISAMAQLMLINGEFIWDILTDEASFQVLWD
jgi:hypothetical protein